MNRLILFFSLSLIGNLCRAQVFSWDNVSAIGDSPNYSDLYYWAAHPAKQDPSDLLPGKKGQLNEPNTSPQVDVFFIYPTLYTGIAYAENPWYADVTDTLLNNRIDESTIKFQASVFNETCRVFSPRYRQAHLSVFSETDLVLKDSVLKTAFQDVEKAFRHYLEKENQGRPFIIASHSQGSVHAAWLIQSQIENSPLQKQLVAAYLVGMPLKKDLFENLKPCEDAAETGCWITWNTYARKYYPKHFFDIYKNALSTNPLNWKINDTYAHRRENIGGLLRDFDKIRPKLTDAQNHQGILWIRKPHFPGRIFVRMKRYHVADYNLFYMNIRENVALRANHYLTENPRL